MQTLSDHQKKFSYRLYIRSFHNTGTENYTVVHIESESSIIGPRQDYEVRVLSPPLVKSPQ